MFDAFACRRQGLVHPDAGPAGSHTTLALLRDDPLPTGKEALEEPCTAFPSWFLRIECDRCGKVQMVNDAH